MDENSDEDEAPQERQEQERRVTLLTMRTEPEANFLNYNLLCRRWPSLAVRVIMRRVKIHGEGLMCSGSDGRCKAGVQRERDVGRGAERGGAGRTGWRGRHC